MIIAGDIKELMEWLEIHRPDKGIDKPYVIPVKLNNGYQLDNDSLIEKGLRELNMPYKVVELFNEDWTEVRVWTPKNISLEKLYFSTPEERDSFNAAEAEYAGADPSIPYLETGEDENGYYVLVDVIAKPSLWERFKNWF
jgi:hypothetical protein